MGVHELPLEGAYLLIPDVVADHRGCFARAWSQAVLSARDLVTDWAYAAFARNTRRGTLRGMHYQSPPMSETKLVSCVQGAIWDVIVDIRTDSPTFAKWHAEHLSGDSLRSLYVPVGFAHGYMTLEDDALVSYLIGTDYEPEAAEGFRYDDAFVAIEWPASPIVMSDRDANLPGFVERGRA